MSKNSKKLRIVLLGAPSSGKGTQAELLSQKLGLKHLASGDVFRQEVKKKSELGKAIEDYLKKGKLVPDELVNKVIISKIRKTKKGIILDGYPRDLTQAKFLEKNFPTDLVLEIKISNKEALKRITGRRVCSYCGAVYHLKYKPPKKKGICDICGHKLVQRDDDRRGIAEKRLKLYHQTIKPIIKFYKRKDKLFIINGEQSIKKVFQDILKIVLRKKDEKK